MNYLALLIPVSMGYIANYYSLKHDYKYLQQNYTVLLLKYREELKRNGDNNE